MNKKASAGHGGKSGRNEHIESAGRPVDHVPNRTEQDLARSRKREVKIVEVEK